MIVCTFFQLGQIGIINTSTFLFSHHHLFHRRSSRSKMRDGINFFQFFRIMRSPDSQESIAMGTKIRISTKKRLPVRFLKNIFLQTNPESLGNSTSESVHNSKKLYSLVGVSGLNSNKVSKYALNGI